jgi:hypothetical protein
MNELNHTNGKGDKDRSPGWRDNYDAIDFHRGEATDGFSRRENRLVKTYTPGRRAVFTVACGGTRCQPVGAPCNSQSFDRTWVCSLNKGHAGDHIACSMSAHDLAHWPRTTAEVSADMLAKGVKL